MTFSGFVTQLHKLHSQQWQSIKLTTQGFRFKYCWSPEVFRFCDAIAFTTCDHHSYLQLITASLKWRWSAPDIQELPLLTASSYMTLLPWLANPGNPAMSPHAEGNPSYWYNIYSGNKGQRQNGATMNTRGIHTHVNNRRLLTSQGYQCWHRCTNQHRKMHRNADPWWVH